VTRSRKGVRGSVRASCLRVGFAVLTCSGGCHPGSTRSGRETSPSPCRACGPPSG
jgi:hypothetical protein